MQEFRINLQQVEFIKQALSEGTFPFAGKNLLALIDMLSKLPLIEEDKKDSSDPSKQEKPSA
jgi:hypothetical protein